MPIPIRADIRPKPSRRPVEIKIEDGGDHDRLYPTPQSSALAWEDWRTSEVRTELQEGINRPAQLYLNQDAEDNMKI